MLYFKKNRIKDSTNISKLSKECTAGKPEKTNAKDAETMKVIDLTHTITEKMPVFPGTEQPQLITVNNYDENGFRETLLKITTHTGTHIDTPAHVYSGKATLDALPPEQFIGKALVINCRSIKPGSHITLQHITAYGTKAKAADFCCSTLAGINIGH